MGAGRLRVAALMVSDALCIVGVWAFVVSAYYFVGIAKYEPSAYLQAWPVIVLFVFVNGASRLYHGRGTYPGMPLGPVEEFRRLVLSAVLTHLLVMAYLGFSREVEQISRFVLVVSGLLTALTAQAFRDVVRGLLRRFRLGQIPAFVVGEGETAELLDGAERHAGIRAASVIEPRGGVDRKEEDDDRPGVEVGGRRVKPKPREVVGEDDERPDARDAEGVRDHERGDAKTARAHLTSPPSRGGRARTNACRTTRDP